MRNLKIEKNLIGEEYWPHLSSVFVKGIPEQKEIPENIQSEEKEKIIQSWSNIAILKVNGNPSSKFYFGFSNLQIMQYLKYEFFAPAQFGVRIGPDDIRFFALPIDMESEITIELVEITNENNENYNDLILI